MYIPERRHGNSLICGTSRWLSVGGCCGCPTSACSFIHPPFSLSTHTSQIATTTSRSPVFPAVVVCLRQVMSPLLPDPDCSALFFPTIRSPSDRLTSSPSTAFRYLNRLFHRKSGISRKLSPYRPGLTISESTIDTSYPRWLTTTTTTRT